MNNILTGIIITGCGKHTFKELYDELGNPVKVVLEKGNEDVILGIIYDDEAVPDNKQTDCGISEEEIDRVCAAHDDCDSCPMNDHCAEE